MYQAALPHHVPMSTAMSGSLPQANPVLAALREVSWLQSVRLETLQRLAEHGQVLHFRRNATVQLQGEEVHAFMVLLQGQVHAARLQDDRPAVHLRQAARMDCLAEVELLDGQPAHAHWRAVSDAKVVAVSRWAFVSALRFDGHLAAQLARHVSQRLRQVNQRLMLLSCCTVEQRVLQIMRDWAQPDGRGQWVVVRPVTQRELACMAAASREMTSRALARLKAKGLLRFDSWARVEVVMAEPAPA